MIEHHPGDDLLLAVAAGRLRAADALLVATHLESCPACRARLHTLQAVGGALVDEAEPQPLAADAWARTLARIDAPAPPAGAPATMVPTHPVASGAPRIDLPAGVPWPSSLRGCVVSPWRWMGPGMRFARVMLPADPAASLFLLRIREGRSLPRHTHGGVELTQVLSGSFDDGRSVFGAGDFDAADGEVHHQPVVAAGEDCVCLAHVSGRLRFDGRIAAVIGGWVGM
jgi:putative transcriptional regulator